MIGIIATILTTSSILPQLYKTYKLKEAEHLSLVQMLVLFVGIACWFCYAWTINNYTIMTANAISMFLQSILIGMRIKYGNR